MSPRQMVARATADGAADNEYGKENLYGGNPSWTCFTQLYPAI